MRFEAEPLSGNFIVLAAESSSVSRALSILQARRVSWLVTKLGEKWFVFAVKDAIMLGGAVVTLADSAKSYLRRTDSK